MAPGAQFLGSGAAKDAFTFDNLMKQGMVIVGDPDYVTEQIRFQTGKMGADHFMIYAPFGTLPMESATASLELFAKEVLPNLS
jgi:alkanesulfonate monooxygenase SsuD/methylene tetrahydromethanopterin reductase-like flavin-dependent oxidoreductase (luciferase family)